MSLIIVDQILTIVYYTIDECVFLSCCGPVKSLFTMSFQILIGSATGRVDGIVNIPAKRFGEPCKEIGSFIDCQFWEIGG